MRGIRAAPAILISLGLVLGTHAVWAQSVPSLVAQARQVRTAATLLVANDFGDTVWTQDATLGGGTQSEYAHARPSNADSMVGCAIWCESEGTPLVAILEAGDGARPARAEIIRLLEQAGPRKYRGAGDRLATRIREPGYYGPAARPWLFGWDMHWDLRAGAQRADSLRLIFFVVGRPDSAAMRSRPTDRGDASSRRDLANREPWPVVTHPYLRAHELSRAEKLATCRVVGEMICDFSHRSLRIVARPE